MTTIAYHEESKTIASDGQATMGDTISSLDIKKVHNINGSLVGFAGRLSSGLKFLEWFEEWDTKSQLNDELRGFAQVEVPPMLVEDDFMAIVINTQGVAYTFEGGSVFYKTKGNLALGSGSDFALGAMDAGLGAEEAVEVAKGRDVFSGGETFVEILSQCEEKLSVERAKEMSKGDLISLWFGEDQLDDDTEEVLQYSQQWLHSEVLGKLEDIVKKLCAGSFKLNKYDNDGSTSYKKEFYASCQYKIGNILTLSTGEVSASFKYWADDGIEHTIIVYSNGTVSHKEDGGEFINRVTLSHKEHDIWCLLRDYKTQCQDLTKNLTQ